MKWQSLTDKIDHGLITIKTSLQHYKEYSNNIVPGNRTFKYYHCSPKILERPPTEGMLANPHSTTSQTFEMKVLRSTQVEPLKVLFCSPMINFDWGYARSSYKENIFLPGKSGINVWSLCVIQQVDRNKGREGETSQTTRQDKGMHG